MAKYAPACVNRAGDGVAGRMGTECITENKRPKMAPGKVGLVGGGGGWELKSPALDARA